MVLAGEFFELEKQVARSRPRRHTRSAAASPNSSPACWTQSSGGLFTCSNASAAIYPRRRP